MNPLFYWISLILIIFAIIFATKKRTQYALLLLLTTQLIFIYLNVLEHDLSAIAFWIVATIVNIQILRNS